MEGLERDVQTKNDNFVISKALTIDNRPEKAQAKQRQQIVKIAINDRYVADNYYQSADMDELMFEKDGTISKMKQLQYKVSKNNLLTKNKQI